MRVLIVEDEIMAQKSLIRLLSQNFPNIEVVGTATSVKSAVNWLRNTANNPDIIFMDVELSDGICFEIFRQIDVKAKVIKQSIDCTPGCPVTETAVFTTKLWR